MAQLLIEGARTGTLDQGIRRELDRQLAPYRRTKSGDWIIGARLGAEPSPGNVTERLCECAREAAEMVEGEGPLLCRSWLLTRCPVPRAAKAGLLAYSASLTAERTQPMPRRRATHG
ncbi:hypothetical protein [Streptomyces sp. NPDC058305]|uniref:hypothetical protein n=1 Tax=Streptomyces sp. NPDC058305 TaxID=3346438 RepID=UPI0036E92A57